MATAKIQTSSHRPYRKDAVPRSRSDATKWKSIRGTLWNLWRRYVPETLMAALDELERHYEKASGTAAFSAGWTNCCTLMLDVPLLFLRPATDEGVGGAKIYLKRRRSAPYRGAQDQQLLGQALMVERNGQASRHRRDWRRAARLATATVCALLGFECLCTWVRKICGGRS